MKILVVFYSKSGHTKKVAENLAKSLKADMDEIVDLKDRSGIKSCILGGRDGMKGSLTEIKTKKNPANYDLVILGTPIWAGNSTPAARTYVTKFKNKIKKLVIFVTADNSGPEKTVEVIEEIWGKKVEIFEGWITEDFKENEKYREKATKFLEKIKETYF